MPALFTLFFFSKVVYVPFVPFIYMAANERQEMRRVQRVGEHMAANCHGWDLETSVKVHVPLRSEGVHINHCANWHLSCVDSLVEF